MKCQQLKDNLERWLAGSAPEFDGHLATCAECRTESEGLRRVSAWIQLRKMPPPQLPEGFWVRFWGRQERRARFWHSLFVLARRTAFALGVLLALLLMSMEWLPQPQEAQRAVMEAPRPYWEQVSGQPGRSGDDLDPDQVVLTLVSGPGGN